MMKVMRALWQFTFGSWFMVHGYFWFMVHGYFWFMING